MATQIAETKAWLSDIIIGLNFCPFAKKEFVNDTIHYYVSNDTNFDKALETLIHQCEFLLNNLSIETGLIIFDSGFDNFDQYLDLLDFSNQLIADSGYEGIFQIASFHPEYCFEGEPADDADSDDAANFTNRSPYPMLHILREESLEKVLNTYSEPELIPEQNIAIAREKGSRYFIDKLNSYKHKS